MKIEQLKYIIEVGRSRSISDAAQKVFLNHTTLSSIVKSIEKELGFSLFERTYNGIQTTTEGEEALAIMEEIYNCFESIQKLGNVNAMLHQPVVIITSPSIHNAVAASINQLFWEQESLGNLEFRVVTGMEVGTNIIQNNSNIGLTYYRKDMLENYRMIASRYQIHTECVFKDHMYLLINKNHPLAVKDEISQLELQNMELAVLEHYVVSETSPLCLKNLGASNRYTVFSNINLIKRAILSQDMAAILPGLAINYGVCNYQHLYKSIPLTDAEQNINTIYLCLIYRTENNLRNQEKTILKCIRNYFKTLPHPPLQSA